MKSRFYIFVVSIIALSPAIAVSETLAIGTANVSVVFTDDSAVFELVAVPDGITGDR